jgi:hypothetical protein
MNKRNIALTALLLAAVLTGVFALSDSANRNTAVGLFYFPAVFLAVVLSGLSHSPGAVAAWSSFILYTLLYWGLFFVIYAILLEYYLLTKAMPHLRDARPHVRQQLVQDSPGGAAETALVAIGRAIKEVERRRRTHFFLRGVPEIDVSAPDEQVGTRALALLAHHRHVKGVLRRFRKELEGELGKAQAGQLILDLHARAGADGPAAPRGGPARP